MVLIENIIPSNIDTSFYQSIISGIFTGFIVSLVVAFIGYFHEREVGLEKIDTNIRNLYINMAVMAKRLGNISSNIFTIQDLEQLPFREVAELSKLNVEFFEKMNLGLFVPIFKNKRLAIIKSELEQYQQVLFNIKNVANELMIEVLKYKIRNQEMLLNQTQATNMDPNTMQGLAMQKNLINISAAKLHEYVTGQTMNLDSIAEMFYGRSRESKKKSWDKIKAVLLSQVDYITR